jgi:sulfite oxidase
MQTRKAVTNHVEEPSRRARSRRKFLQAVCAGGAAAGLTLWRLPGLCADEAESFPAGSRLIVRTAKPPNAEPPLEELVRDWLTPVESFYIRSHAVAPQIDGDRFRLAVEGLVDKRLALSAAEVVDRFPALKAAATLTCAGNRRDEFSGPKISGVQWGAAAIGNAEWSGVALSAVLRQAGVQAGAKHVWFEGSDEVADKGETYPFGGSIPLEKALSEVDGRPACLLATKMNDNPLTPDHGYPLRGIVPGYVGARSVKWLRKIVVSDRPSPNRFLARDYKLITEETPAAFEAAAPIYEYIINSVIAVPSAETAHTPGRLKARGYALPGGAADRTVTRVELSTDGGQKWTAAKIDSPVKTFCWALWSAEVDITPETEGLIVRAADSAGNTQPREMHWNAKGYQYNAWHAVRLKK